MFPWLTPLDQRWLERDASICESLRIEADDPFSIALLEAAKQNPFIEEMWITEAAIIRRDVLYALADYLSTMPHIRMISFRSFQYHDVGTGNDDPPVPDDYRSLIAAIGGSPSPRDIQIVCNDLPLELESAMVEGLKRRSTPTALSLISTSFVMRNPTGFGELLATTQNLDRLVLRCAEFYDVHGTTLRDALRSCQSLKYLSFSTSTIPDVGMDNTIKCVFDGLEGNQSLETLVLENLQLDSTGLLLLNKIISNHKTLSTLEVNSDVYVSSDSQDSLCEAVSHSQSISELVIKGRLYHASAVSHMLQQSKSLQKLSLGNPYEVTAMERDCVDMGVVAEGVKACKTLTTLNCCYLRYDMKCTRAFLDAVIVNQNLEKIDPLPSRSHYDEAELKMLKTELRFYLAFNQTGRSLVRTIVPSGLWPYALEKAGRSSLLDLLYFFLQENPDLVM